MTSDEIQAQLDAGIDVHLGHGDIVTLTDTITLGPGSGRLIAEGAEFRGPGHGLSIIT